jgi:uncharacterized protein (DUF2164 family)
MAINLSKDAKARLMPSLQRFFADELDLELGEMKVHLVLDYMLKELGPLVYNAAIKDAERFVSDRVADLEASCYEKEFTYWPEKSKGRSR